MKETMAEMAPRQPGRMRVETASFEMLMAMQQAGFFLFCSILARMQVLDSFYHKKKVHIRFE